MTVEMWVALAILLVAMVLFITEAIRLDLVALGVMTALMLTGILTIDEGLAGFSNKVVISIAALFIVGGAVFQTGLAGAISARILRVAHGDATRLLIILMVAIALMSAFISSTGVVALMLPAVISLVRSMKISASKLLIPMAYSALLGGSLTLIGTPPNMLASDILRGAGLPPFDFFSFTPVGLALLVVGVIYMATVGRRLLPDPKTNASSQKVVTPGELFALYELPGRLFRVRVQEESPLVGKTIGESGLGREYHLKVISVHHALPHNHDRHGKAIWTPRLPRNHAEPSVPQSDTPLAIDDVLVLHGSAEALSRATGALKLAVMAANPVVEDDIITNEVGIAEVLVRPWSPLLGKTIAELRFSRTYRLTVLSIKRSEGTRVESVKDTKLQLGDVLLVQGEWRDIFALKRLRQDFIVMGEREAVELGALSRPDKAPITLVILLAMVIVVAFNIADLALASLIAALAVILTGCLNVDDAYNTIDLKTLFLMAGMLPMSTALQKVGLVDMVAAQFVASVGQYGPLMIQVGLFMLTVLVTQVLSNTATAVLIAPLALATGLRLGVQPHALVMTVSVAASMAFATPLASPVNTLVISAGDYAFKDYLRVGTPMIVLSLIVTILVLPLIFPF